MGASVGSMLLGAGSAGDMATSIYNNERNIAEQRRAQNSQNEFQAEQNQIDRDFQSSEWDRQFSASNEEYDRRFSQENREWERRFNLENEYNDPSAVVSRLRAAGINPAAAMGQLTGTGGLAAAGGSSTPSLPGMPTPSMAAPHAVTSVGVSPIASLPHISSLLTGVSEFMNAQTNAKRLGLDTKRQDVLLDAELKRMLADARFKDSASVIQEIQGQVDSVFKSRQAASSFMESLSRVALLINQSKTEEARTELTKTENMLAGLKHGIIEEAKPTLLANLGKLGANLSSQTSLNLALGDKAREETQTIAALRSGQVRGQELANMVTEAEQVIKSNDAALSSSTFYPRMEALLDQCENQKWITKEQAEKAKQAIKNSDWQTAEKILQSIKTGTSAAKDIFSAASQVAGAAMLFK